MKFTRRQLRKLIYEAIGTERVDESLFGFLGGMLGGGQKPYSQLSEKELNNLWREWYVIVNTPQKTNVLGYATGAATDNKMQWLKNNVSKDPRDIKEFMSNYRNWLKSDDFLAFQNTPQYNMAREKRTTAYRDQLKEGIDIKEIKIKEIERAVRKCLEKEGGAAGLGLLVKSVKALETKRKKLPKNLKSNKKIAKCILKMNFVVKHRYDDIILTIGLPKVK